MHFLRRLSPFLPHHHHHLLHRRHFYDPSATAGNRFFRDTGLDHAVFRERDLKPLINLKNLIKSDPSKSLPLSSINRARCSLNMPIRPIDFVRRYPSVFQEYIPENLGVHPHVKLTKEAVELDVEERLIYESVEYKKDLADRVLKLLMICRPTRIKLSALGKLKWELGLPENFVELVVPDFPDYFMVKKGVRGGDDDVLELVCWTDELAVTAMELVWLANKAALARKEPVVRRTRGKKEEEKVLPFRFPMKFSIGFKMDKEYKAFLEEWQNLPYVSPYEGETEKVTTGNEFDKYAVGVLHELLNLYVGVKGDKESLLYIGENLGLRGRFRKALLQHPGIFYVSSKNRMYTVVLRDGYKRGAIIKNNPLIEMRFKYLDLMHKTKKLDEATELQKKDGKPKNKDKQEDQENDGSDDSDDEEVTGLSDEDSDREEDDEQGDYYDDSVNKKILGGGRRISARAICNESRGERSPSSNRNIDYKGKNLYPRSNRNNDNEGRDASPRFNGKDGYQAENSSPKSNKKDGYKDENSFARSKGSSDVARQGWGADRENNVSGERQYNRQQRGAERENKVSGERQFNRPRCGNERENSMSGERGQFNRPRRGIERENSRSGERQFNRPQHGSERENMSGERSFNKQRRGAEKENNMSGEGKFNRQRKQQA